MNPYRCLLPVLLLLLNAPWACGQTNQPSTASAGVEVHEHAIYVPYSSSWRTIRVYTPPSYLKGEQRYPVIYALDGQNLFDDRTSYAGEWRMDEAIDSLAVKGYPEAIVVGIDNHGAFRIQEYSLHAHDKYGFGLGSLFLEFVKGDLKKYIDSTFRTLAGPEHTAIIGSSLGGLMAFSAILRYPEVYSKAGVYSPSFWIAEAYYELPEDPALLAGKQIDLVAGDQEGPSMTEPFTRMRDSLQIRFPDLRLRSRMVPGGMHNETSWARQFPQTYTWWFPFRE